MSGPTFPLVNGLSVKMLPSFRSFIVKFVLLYCASVFQVIQR